MYSVTWIDNAILETVATPSIKRARILMLALSIIYKSVRVWKDGKLVY